MDRRNSSRSSTWTGSRFPSVVSTGLVSCNSYVGTEILFVHIEMPFERIGKGIIENHWLNKIHIFFHCDTNNKLIKMKCCSCGCQVMLTATCCKWMVAEIWRLKKQQTWFVTSSSLRLFIECLFVKKCEQTNLTSLLSDLTKFHIYQQFSSCYSPEKTV